MKIRNEKKNDVQYTSEHIQNISLATLKHMHYFIICTV